MSEYLSDVCVLNSLPSSLIVTNKYATLYKRVFTDLKSKLIQLYLQHIKKYHSRTLFLLF